MRPLTILLVEDEPVIALDLQHELEQAGHRVLLAETAADALRLSNRHLPDIAILNFLLENELDGMELARQLRTRYLVQVLFLTGVRREDLESSPAFYAGCEVLHKPFTRRQLQAYLSGL